MYWLIWLILATSCQILNAEPHRYEGRGFPGPCFLVIPPDPPTTILHLLGGGTFCLLHNCWDLASKQNEALPQELLGTTR